MTTDHPSQTAVPTEAWLAERRALLWRLNCRWIVALLVVWFTVTFGAIFFARSLTFKFFGWPFSFWMAAQGSLLVYLGLVVWYARAMNRLETRLELDELD